VDAIADNDGEVVRSDGCSQRPQERARDRFFRYFFGAHVDRLYPRIVDYPRDRYSSVHALPQRQDLAPTIVGKNRRSVTRAEKV
jgi:hypothetical protein